MLISLSVGDQSNDGHCQRDHQLIDSNLTKEEVMIAYNKGCKIVGFNLIKDYCVEFEENCIPYDKYLKLKSLGFTNEENERVLQIYDDDEEMDVYPIWGYELFSKMFLFIAKLGNSNFSFDLIDNNKVTLEIGGYGLFMQ